MAGIRRVFDIEERCSFHHSLALQGAEGPVCSVVGKCLHCLSIGSNFFKSFGNFGNHVFYLTENWTNWWGCSWQGNPASCFHAAFFTGCLFTRLLPEACWRWLTTSFFYFHFVKQMLVFIVPETTVPPQSLRCLSPLVEILFHLSAFHQSCPLLEWNAHDWLSPWEQAVVVISAWVLCGGWAQTPISFQ